MGFISKCLTRTYILIVVLGTIYFNRVSIDTLWGNAVEYVFRIPIPSSVWIIIGIIAAIVLIILFITIIPIITFSITISRDRIRCSSLIMYRATVDRDDVANITIVDLKEHPELKPRIRTFGTGLPGYSLGWFKLANGAKAFLAVSSDKAVVIELRDGTYVILTPKNMDEFVKSLRELGWVK